MSTLYMGNCEALEEFRSGICTLKALEVLYFYGCKYLRRVQEVFEGLNWMKKLSMGNCEALG